MGVLGNMKEGDGSHNENNNINKQFRFDSGDCRSRRHLKCKALDTEHLNKYKHLGPNDRVSQVTPDELGTLDWGHQIYIIVCRARAIPKG